MLWNRGKPFALCVVTSPMGARCSRCGECEELDAVGVVGGGLSAIGAVDEEVQCLRCGAYGGVGAVGAVSAGLDAVGTASAGAGCSRCGECVGWVPLVRWMRGNEWGRWTVCGVEAVCS